MTLTAPKHYDPAETIIAELDVVIGIAGELKQVAPHCLKDLPVIQSAAKNLQSLLHLATVRSLTRSLPPPAPIATGPSRGDAEDVSPRPFQEADAEYTPYWRDL